MELETTGRKITKGSKYFIKNEQNKNVETESKEKNAEDREKKTQIQIKQKGQRIRGISKLEEN